jgi:glycosyltransferase involved in cell wall biosynthesis
VKILFLAPQPFYQDRGTPIAVRLALEVLARSEGHHVDLLCYAEGADVSIPNVALHRVGVPGISGVGPGISLKKLICDVAFAVRACRMVWRARREPYALVHAVEESVFIALFIKWFANVPYVYDMDSSLALQVTEKWWLLKPLASVLEFFERRAVKESVAVVPVCDALAVIATRHGATEAQVLSDISLLNLEQGTPENVDLRAEGRIPPEDLVALYIGNLESYQGIDLLIEGFATVSARVPGEPYCPLSRRGTPAWGGGAGHVSRSPTGIDFKRIPDPSGYPPLPPNEGEQYPDEDLLVSSRRSPDRGDAAYDPHPGHG